MDKNEANNEQTSGRVQVGLKMDPALHAVIEQFRIEEDRPMSNMISVLLKTHPRVQPILEGQTAEVSA